ncbi:Enamine/imine deaminase [compost metagenome]
MKIIYSNNAPEAIGPYSQAIRTGNLLYCSGQTPIDPTTMKIVSTDVKEQTTRAILNLKVVLEEAGLNLSNIIKMNVYLTNMENFPQMNEAYAICLGSHRPARTTVAVLGLPYNALVEIECIAEFNEN